MPTRYDTEVDPHEMAGTDREISLGTGTVLAIFLALALVCSLFFGLGYSMGRKSVPASVAAAPAVEERPSLRNAVRGLNPAPADAREPEPQVTQPTEAPHPGATATRDTVEPAPAKPPARDRLTPAKPASAVLEVAAPAPPLIPVAGASPTFVQVAAVSRKEDADLLLTALKRRGYAGLIRPQTQDKLLHIQVGPFPSKKDAELMRQHLITDGYNPILK